MTAVSRPLYERTLDERIAEVLSILPPLPEHLQNEPRFYEFEALDPQQSKLFIHERINRPEQMLPSGTSGMGGNFGAGVILPDGSTLMGTPFNNSRMLLASFHAGWFVTVMSVSVGSSRAPLELELAAERVLEVGDREVARKAWVDFATAAPSTYYEYLLRLHEHHYRRAAKRHHSQSILHV